jgi:acetyl-CoA carboxylase biotin carboxyl carrier protein
MSDAHDAASRHTHGPMIDLRYVKKLIDILDESTVDSIEISSDKGMKIRISKSPSGRGAMQVAQPTVMAPMMTPPMLPTGQPTPAEGTPAVEPPAAPEPKSGGNDVKSPMVGTFYSAPEPGAKPYVSVGSRVSKGQILCIIEAMKIMNEIESEVAGVVTEVLASDAQPVEYGQPLFRIDPNG